MDDIYTSRYLELKKLYDLIVETLHTRNHPAVLSIKLEMDRTQRIYYKT